ncbi:hypothetical protein ACN24M_12045 [Streptomyces microflavus]
MDGRRAPMRRRDALGTGAGLLTAAALAAGCTRGGAGGTTAAAGAPAPTPYASATVPTGPAASPGSPP